MSELDFLAIRFEVSFVILFFFNKLFFAGNSTRGKFLFKKKKKLLCEGFYIHKMKLFEGIFFFFWIIIWGDFQQTQKQIESGLERKP